MNSAPTHGNAWGGGIPIRLERSQARRELVDMRQDRTTAPSFVKCVGAHKAPRIVIGG